MYDAYDPYMNEELDVYFCGDQPTDCPLCMLRTNFTQHGPVECHECQCGYRFYVVPDDEGEEEFD